MEIEAELAQPAVLLVTDVWTPSWRAVALDPGDQRRYEVMPANYVLRAVPLDRGRHRLRLEYAPGAFRIGAAVSLIALAAWLAAVWLAWQAVTRGSAFSPDTARRAPRSLLRNWATGLGINLLNPKILLFFMTFLPQFVSASDPDAPGQLFFLGLLFILISLPITAPMVVAADRLAGLLEHSPRVTRIIDWLFAGVFSAFALKIITAQSR